MISARARWLALAPGLLIALVAASACSDDDGGDGASDDAGAPIDARRHGDADVVACAPGDTDAGCDPASPTPVCDGDRGACVECEGDGDCARERAYGPDCRAGDGTCGCAADDDCQANLNGPRCHEIVRACTCIDDGDCEEGEDCKMEPYLGAGVRVCRQLE